MGSCRSSRAPTRSIPRRALARPCATDVRACAACPAGAAALWGVYGAHVGSWTDAGACLCVFVCYACLQLAHDRNSLLQPAAGGGVKSVFELEGLHLTSQEVGERAGGRRPGLLPCSCGLREEGYGGFGQGLQPSSPWDSCEPYTMCSGASPASVQCRLLSPSPMHLPCCLCDHPPGADGGGDGVLRPGRAAQGAEAARLCAARQVDLPNHLCECPSRCSLSSPAALACPLGLPLCTCPQHGQHGCHAAQPWLDR